MNGFGSVTEIGLAVVVVAAAGLLRGFSGFGSALLNVPALSVLIDPREAVVISILLDAILSLQLMPEAIAKAHWKRVAPLIAAALLTIPVGTLLLAHAQASWIRIGTSGAVTLLVALLLSGVTLRRASPRAGALGAGAMSGFLQGAGGIGGPPLILFMLAQPLPAAEKRADIIAIAGIVILSSALITLGRGAVNRDLALGVLVLAPPLVLATHAGVQLFGRTTNRTYQRLALGALGGTSLLILLTSL